MNSGDSAPVVPHMVQASTAPFTWHVAMGAAWGYIFPVIALLVVLAMIFGSKFVAERVQNAISKRASSSGGKDKCLKILDTIALDQKRRVSAIEVKDPSGKKATVVVLTGGGEDVCLGWMPNECSGMEDLSPPMKSGEVSL